MIFVKIFPKKTLPLKILSKNTVKHTLRAYLTVFLLEVFLVKVFYLQVVLDDFLIFLKCFLNFFKQLIFLQKKVLFFLFILKVLYRNIIKRTLKSPFKYDQVAL